jgi:hypothetical protein
MNYNYKGKPITYTVNVQNIKASMINVHLNFLHNAQLDMIDAAVEKSDLRDANEVIKYIMEK